MDSNGDISYQERIIRETAGIAYAGEIKPHVLLKTVSNLRFRRLGYGD